MIFSSASLSSVLNIVLKPALEIWTSSSSSVSPVKQYTNGVLILLYVKVLTYVWKWERIFAHASSPFIYGMFWSRIIVV